MTKKSPNEPPVLHHRASRRMFLKGIGGGLGAAAAATALPFLPSLTSRASADALGYDRVIFVVWSHGVHLPLWHPQVPGFREVGPSIRAASMRDATMGLYMGDSFRGLEDKISILRGVGQVGAWGHQTSVALTASERGEDVRYRITSTAPESIDNVLARSSVVYPTRPAVDVLRLSMGSLDETHSYRDFNHVSAVSAEVAYAQLFGGGFPDDAPAPTGPSDEERRARRRLVSLERSLAQYRTLRDSGRLSTIDRIALERTIDQYAALESSLRGRLDALAMPPAATATCTEFALSGVDDSEQKMRDHVNLFTQGLACGATRVGYWRLRSSHADVDGAHQAHSSANREVDGLYTSIMRRNLRWTAELLRSMDGVVEANGRTLLDNSLVVVTSDMATSVIGEHPGVDAPFLLAGGLGGKIRMGEYIDYADPAARLTSSHGYEYYAGPPHNELLIGVMRAFGLDAAEWGGGGFGQYQCVRDRICTDTSPYVTQRKYVDYYRDVHSRIRSPGAELPYLRV
ncbi:MAG: DUF1552 domain-containing protein [Myxococcota bacterium]|nr:DUF1552 domain-containing protein [Myxococcota bacterium]